MKKILSLVLSGIVASSLMVGCSNKETVKETVIIKYQDEQGNTIKEKEVTKEEAQEIKEQNKSKEIKKEVNNKSEIKEESKTNQQSDKVKQQTNETKENTTKEDKSNTKKETPKVEDKKEETKEKEEVSKFYSCDKCGKYVSKNKEYFPYCYNCYIRIKKQVENMNKEDEEVKKEEPKEKEDDYKLDVNADEPEEKQIEIFKCDKCGGNIYWEDVLGNRKCKQCYIEKSKKENEEKDIEPLRDPENDIQE